MIEINITPEHLRKKQKTRILASSIFHFSREALIGLIGGFLVFLFSIHFILQMIVFVNYAQYKRNQKQWAHILPEKQKADIIIFELRDLQGKIKSIEKVRTEKRILWSQKLNEISDTLPRGVWLNKMSVNQTVLLIDGSVVSKSKDEMASVSSFASNLKNNSKFMQGLKSLELGSMQRRQIKAADLADFIITVKLQ